MQGPNIYRKEALQHQFTSPEDLERPFKLLRIGPWLPLLGLAVICVAAVVWAIVGRVPETVEGTGLLLNPGRVRALESIASGQVTEVRITLGQAIREGEVIAVLSMVEMRQQMTQAKQRLEELLRTDRLQSELETLRVDQEKALRIVQEKTLDLSIKDFEELLTRQEKQGDAALLEQRKVLETSLDETKKLNEALKAKVEAARRLAASRVISGENLLQAESALADNNSNLSSLQVRITELGIKDTETRQALVTQRGRLADYRVQRAQLEVRSTQLEQELAFSRATRRIQLQEQEDRIKQLEASLQEQGQVRSPYTGRILEVGVLPGQAVSPGAVLATLELGTVTERDPGLRNLAYFPIKSGKRIRPGMVVRVAPSTVQRERYGSIIGVVRRVSEFPVTARGPAAAVGNAELARGLLAPGGVIEVEVDLERGETPTGFVWTSAGPEQPLTAGTTTRTTVTVEERAPITFLLPILRGWLDTPPPELPPGGPGAGEGVGPQ